MRESPVPASRLPRASCGRVHDRVHGHPPPPHAPGRWGVGAGVVPAWFSLLLAALTSWATPESRPAHAATSSALAPKCEKDAPGQKYKHVDNTARDQKV